LPPDRVYATLRRRARRPFGGEDTGHDAGLRASAEGAPRAARRHYWAQTEQAGGAGNSAVPGCRRRGSVREARSRSNMTFIREGRYADPQKAA